MKAIRKKFTSGARISTSAFLKKILITTYKRDGRSHLSLVSLSRRASQSFSRLDIYIWHNYDFSDKATRPRQLESVGSNRFFCALRHHLFPMSRRILVSLDEENASYSFYSVRKSRCAHLKNYYARWFIRWSYLNWFKLSGETAAAATRSRLEFLVAHARLCR